MTLKDFMARVRAEADRFEDIWINNNEESPQHWPMEMGLADWWEQFTFSELED